MNTSIQNLLLDTPEARAELRVLVAEARGWTKCPCRDGRCKEWLAPNRIMSSVQIPRWSTSLDACRELLADLTEEELKQVADLIIKWTSLPGLCVFGRLLLATAQQICVAYLIVKGVLK